MNIKKLALLREKTTQLSQQMRWLLSLSPPLILCPKGKLYQSQLPRVSKISSFSLSLVPPAFWTLFLRLWCVESRKQKELFARWQMKKLLRFNKRRIRRPWLINERTRSQPRGKKGRNWPGCARSEWAWWYLARIKLYSLRVLLSGCNRRCVLDLEWNVYSQWDLSRFKQIVLPHGDQMKKAHFSG